jgi:hypothetical protein
VIARQGGGALETVLDGVTGCFWSGGADQLARAVLEFGDASIDPELCVANAARFDAASFRRGILTEVGEALATSPPHEVARRPLATARLIRRAARDARR